MKHTLRNVFAFGSMVVCCWTVMATVVSGAVITLIDEPFDTAGPLPAGWEYFYSSGTPDAWTAPTVVANLGLRMRRNDSATDNPHVYYSGGTWSDLQGTAIFNTGNVNLNNWAMGYSIRAPSMGVTPGGYLIVVGNRESAAPNLTTPFIGIFRGDVGPTLFHQRTRSENLAYTDIDVALASDTDYRFEFSAYGNDIFASFWTTDASPTLLGSVALDLTTIDPALQTTEAGFFGLVSLPGSNGRQVYVRDLEVFKIIPEPSTVGLFGLAVLVLRLLRRETGLQLKQCKQHAM